MTWTKVFPLLLSACLLAGSAFAAEPALTIYNQRFAVVRQTFALELAQGLNTVKFTDTPAFVEPDSVILKDPAREWNLRILEQNYWADPASQELLLSLFEGRTLDFLVQRGETLETIQGKVIRSGHKPDSSWVAPLSATIYGRPTPVLTQPIVEVDGKLRFGLPGIPLFPTLGDDSVLKPTLNWQIESDQAGRLEAELSYVTGGMSWEADYNVVAPEEGDSLEIVGWVTIENRSGKTFDNARIKLMAGEVSKIQPTVVGQEFARVAGGTISGIPGPPVLEKRFDEYHLYSLSRPSTLRDGESKQVEFIRADSIRSERLYVYDGLWVDENHYRGWSMESIRQDRNYGVQSNPSVWVLREFVNSEANHLGIPLPQGRLRFYRRDADGQLEFTGENRIEHTPKDETIRVYTGTAFDLVGERRRTDYRIDTSRRWLDESFEIVLRNHKEETVEIRVVEHLYRGQTWEILENTDTFLKTDSQTAEFRVTVQPGQPKTIRYTVHYTW